MCVSKGGKERRTEEKGGEEKTILDPSSTRWLTVRVLLPRRTKTKKRFGLMTTREGGSVAVKGVSESVQQNERSTVYVKQACEDCEALKKEVLVLNERSTVYRNVLITSLVGLTVVVGVVVGMLKW
ncbi:hypothetical protein Bca52824_000804 [Brassica carinata]|uniref:Transmembrane protein n=1 Tax=Brassica carinata TaxID=52824 RepID=A0A8X7WF62_BRACI|nr:hypothetical protein Bca52824_000804 [Brassica carinata]